MHWVPSIDLIRYWLGTLLAIMLPPAVVYWFIVHPFIGFWRRVGMKGAFWFLGIFMVGSMAALYPFRGALLEQDLGTRWPLLLLAVPLIVVSAIISRKRRRYLDFKTLAGAAELSPGTHGKGLFTEGIYGRMRHPRYVEFTLGLIGWSLVCNYRGLYVVTALSVAGLFVIVLFEEKELRERFGQDYGDYAARVPRFMPKLSGQRRVW